MKTIDERVSYVLSYLPDAPAWLELMLKDQLEQAYQDGKKALMKKAKDKMIEIIEFGSAE